MHTIACGRRAFTPSKLICVGKNYPSHIEEMGGGLRPSQPTIFLKPNSAIAFEVDQVFIPEEFGLIHHEVELCFAVGRTGRDIPLAEAHSYIAGYGVGIDFTLRDLQAVAKRSGAPWSLAKGFDAAAPLGRFVEANSVGDPCGLAIVLTVNGISRQSASTSEMIFSPEEILSFVSEFMTVEEGDVFMCGTPSGVGEVRHGDVLHAEIAGLPPLKIEIIRKGSQKGI